MLITSSQIVRQRYLIWGCVGTNGMGNLQIWKDTNKAERYIQVLHKKWCCHQSNVFFKDAPCLFQQVNALQCASVKRMWPCGKRVRVVEVKVKEVVSRSKRVRVAQWSRKYDNGDPGWKTWIIEQLKLYIKQEWETIPPAKLQQLVQAIPTRVLLKVLKGKV